MAVKTFTAGDVLTASDTNTYLANAGLVYVTTATATSGTSVSISNCFSSTFDNYRVTLVGKVGSGGIIQLRYRTSGDDGSTNYRWGRGYYKLNNTDNGTTGAVAGTEASLGGMVANERSAFVFDFFSPNLAEPTLHSSGINFEPTGSTATAYLGWCGGQMNTTTQYTGITFFFPGTISTMTITVFGYRKA